MDTMQVGDPIETAAVANIFGEYGIYIGSVRNPRVLKQTGTEIKGQT
jgi:hypothetical protein